MTARTLRTALVAATLIAGFASVAPAQTTSIEYRPSELRTIEGQRRVIKRIERAARYACPTYGHLVRTPAFKACVDELSADIVRNTRSSALLAVYSRAANTQLAGNAH